jgi:hypothetical protein
MRPRGRFAVKRWLCLALACWAMVYLLLSLGQQAAVNYDPRTPGGDRSMGLCREPASARAWAATRLRFHHTRAEPLESLPIHFVLLTTADAGPPWLDTRGPPRRLRPAGTLLNCKAAGQTGSSKQWRSTLPLLNSYPSTHQTKEAGFCNSL